MSERTAGAEKPTLLQIQLSDPILHLIEDVMCHARGNRRSNHAQLAGGVQ